MAELPGVESEGQAVSFLFWLLLAWVTDRVQLSMCARNYGAPWNGVGAIDRVLAKTALAPMAYRVLMPWLVGLVERIYPHARSWRIEGVYEPLKILMMAWAFWGCELAIGREGALLVIVLLSTTYLYDYWSWAPEMAALAFALSGNLPLAIVGAVLGALSKPETALLAPLTYLFVTWDWLGAVLIGAAVVIPWAGVRLWAGQHKLYCERWTWRKNLRCVQVWHKNHPVYFGSIVMSGLLSVLTLGVVVTGRGGPAWPVPLLLLGAGWTMALVNETRVLAPLLIWIAGGLL